MQRNQGLITAAMLFTGLLLFAVFGTILLAGPISFLYNSVAGMTTFTNVTQIAALVAAAALFVAGLIVAVPTMLRPASWLGKVLRILPIYLLAFLLVGAISDLIGLGATGTLFQSGSVMVTFILAWLLLGSVLSLIAVVIASARAHLSPGTQRSQAIAASIASGLGVIAAIALAVTVVIVSTNQPSFGNFGGGPPGAGQQNRGTQGGGNPSGFTPAGTQEAPNTQGGASNGNRGASNPSGFAPAVTQQASGTQELAPAGNRSGSNPPVIAPSGTQEVSPGQSGAPSGNRGQGGQQGGSPAGTQEVSPGRGGAADGNRGQGGPGGVGGPGGFGAGITNSVNQYKIGGSITAVLGVISLVLGIAVLRTPRAVPAAARTSTLPATTVSYPRELGRVVVSALGLTIVLFLAIQLVPTQHSNPAVQTQIKWDSAQTQQLWVSACSDCHSSETRWPWYSYVAPMSWLTTMHVRDGREQYNLSDFDSLPSFRRQMLPDLMAMEIRTGMMPPKDYQILHPDARLSDTEKQELIDGIQKSLAATP